MGQYQSKKEDELVPEQNGKSSSPSLHMWLKVIGSTFLLQWKSIWYNQIMNQNLHHFPTTMRLLTVLAASKYTFRK
jgi:hypothetical protein